MITVDVQVGLKLQNIVKLSFFKFVKIVADVDKNLHFRNKDHNCLN